MFDIETFPPAVKDKARMVQIQAAALRLMSKCVYDKRAGGIMTGLGTLSHKVLRFFPFMILKSYCSVLHT